MNKGMTLLEATLALSLSALLMVAVSSAVQVSSKGWAGYAMRGELVQHGRFAMTRLMRELNFATRLIDPGPELRFYTTNLYSDYPDEVLVEYDWNPPLLLRSQSGAAFQTVAGTDSAQGEFGGVSVTNFQITPLELDGSNDLTSAAPADAIAVRVELELADADAHTLLIRSTAQLRNK